MISGRVQGREARLSLSIRDSGGAWREVDAVIDTGFDGYLTLPSDLVDELSSPLVGFGRALLADGQESVLPIHEVTIDWDNEHLTVESFATGNAPLLGMSLPYGCQLRIEVWTGGDVRVTRRDAS